MRTSPILHNRRRPTNCRLGRRPPWQRKRNDHPSAVHTDRIGEIAHETRERVSVGGGYILEIDIDASVFRTPDEGAQFCDRLDAGLVMIVWAQVLRSPFPGSRARDDRVGQILVETAHGLAPVGDAGIDRQSFGFQKGERALGHRTEHATGQVDRNATRRRTLRSTMNGSPRAMPSRLIHMYSSRAPSLWPDRRPTGSSERVPASPQCLKPRRAQRRRNNPTRHHRPVPRASNNPRGT